LLFSCAKKYKTYIETIAVNDVKLPKARPGDWRYSRDEKFQTFEDFQKLEKIKPEPKKKTQYIFSLSENSMSCRKRR
jgi:archaemetzincin